jgi:hypothetical protein
MAGKLEIIDRAEMRITTHSRTPESRDINWMPVQVRHEIYDLAYQQAVVRFYLLDSDFWLLDSVL